MERRLLLAFALTALVLVLTPLLTPKRPVSLAVPQGVDTAGAESATVPETTGVPTAPLETATPAIRESISTSGPPGDTIAVRTSTAIYRVSTVGAAPIGATMLEYEALGAVRGGLVELAKPGVPLLSYGLIVSGDTVDLGELPFHVQGDITAASQGRTPLQFRGVLPGGGEVTISYSFVPDSYVVRVEGQVAGTRTGSLLVHLPSGIRSAEADSTDDQRHLAYVLKPVDDDARSVPFSKLEGTRRLEPGSFTWVATKTKYFLMALLTREGGRPFSNLVFQGRSETDAEAMIEKPLTPEGRFGFEIYAGPQEWRRLVAMGRELENANPYGGWLQGFVQPFATIVMRMLLWMHDTLKLSYGWVLVIFGIVVRLILWPLNQSAMRTSVRMQRIQPQLMEIQKRHRQQPEKAHQEMMRLYKEHNLSPFSMFSGCLPMLLPMPVLFALFFVFQNTIEFRGVSFLWLPDISLKDPFYIIPILMGASMYLLSWIGMRGVPPNPQTKMMTYIFPGFMTFLFLNFPSGLNLYYAVQNIAALPQQWLIARERSKAGPPAKAPGS